MDSPRSGSAVLAFTLMEDLMENESARIDERQLSTLTYTVDSFNNGIAFGQHKLEAGMDPRDHYSLAIGEEGEVTRLRSRYALHKTNPFWELERYLMRLSRLGALASSTIYFGTSTDPFYPFEGKFDASMKFLQLFERYTPGLLVIQTRSPLVVIAMPVLRKLGRHASVTIGLETNCEEAVQRYTPGLPRVDERLKAAIALRTLGVETSLQVAPLLPYGDWKKDAAAFAEVLANHADYVYVQPLSRGSADVERKLRNSPLAQRLAEDRRFHWLRHDSANPLIGELEKIAPQKLVVPIHEHHSPRQMSIFAA